MHLVPPQKGDLQTIHFSSHSWVWSKHSKLDGAWNPLLPSMDVDGLCCFFDRKVIIDTRTCSRNHRLNAWIGRPGTGEKVCRRCSQTMQDLPPSFRPKHHRGPRNGSFCQGTYSCRQTHDFHGSSASEVVGVWVRALVAEALP